MSTVAIINPLSGAGADPTAATRRAAMLRAEAEHRGVALDVHVTERGGHAHELAAAAVASGTPLVIAWGGDGTINEVGCALARTPTILGVVPAGSGNGLAAALGVPREPRAAIGVAFDGSTRAIDAGVMAGRPFFNVAGVGFDARIARVFNERAQGRRGRWPYISIGVREGCRYRAAEYRLTIDGRQQRLRALLMVFANGREFGMGARIAPRAELDDGLLDATIIADRSVLGRFLDAPYLAFAATHRARGVSVMRIRAATIEADEPIEFHVDGEPAQAEGRVDVAIVPGALRVRTPRAPAASG